MNRQNHLMALNKKDNKSHLLPDDSISSQKLFNNICLHILLVDIFISG